MVGPEPYLPDRGDVIWLQFNPQAGHEQAGRRPALVVSRRSYNGKVGLALVCSRSCCRAVCRSPGLYWLIRLETWPGRQGERILSVRFHRMSSGRSLKNCNFSSNGARPRSFSKEKGQAPLLKANVGGWMERARAEPRPYDFQGQFEVGWMEWRAGDEGAGGFIKIGELLFGVVGGGSRPKIDSGRRI